MPVMLPSLTENTDLEALAAELGDTGRILVRESGTELLIRVMVEAESEERCRALVEQVVDVIRRKGHAVD